MEKYKEFNDFKSCIEAVGSYYNLHAMLCFLVNNDYNLNFSEDTLDEAYDSIQYDEFLNVLLMFDINELDSDENNAVFEFLNGVDFTVSNFKRKCVKFIVKEILPHRQEWWKEEE